jgi:Ca2+-binding EF-hand superfamily protein
MLTELQARKIERRFALSDADHDGVLHAEDYERSAHTIAALRGWAPGTPEYRTLHATVLGWWQNIRQAADTTGDGTVTRDEWLAFHDRLLATPGMLDKAAEGMVSIFFYAFDLAGDGAMDVRDYRAFLQGLGVTDAAAEDVFPMLDRNADGMLTREEWLELVREFFSSDDPAAPGNQILGPY